MTLRNLVSVAGAIALMTSSVLAQQTTPQDNSTGTPTGPTLTIDLLRSNFDTTGVNTGLPVLGDNGGLMYIVTVTPDGSQGTYQSANGPLGPGGSLALEIGISVPNGIATQVGAVNPVANRFGEDLTAVSVPVNASPGVGISANSLNGEEGVLTPIDFANPGNAIFGFEVLNFDSNDADTALDQITGVQVNTDAGNDSIFAALGTTFFSTGDFFSGVGPYEVLRFETSRLTSSNLTHSATLTGVGDSGDFGGAANSLIVAQSTDLSDSANPQAEVFTPESVTDTDTIFEGDVNLDGAVASDDFFAVLQNFDPGGSTNLWSAGDITGDGAVGSDDFFAVLQNFNPGGAGGSAPAVSAATVVPEPTACVIALLGSVAAFAKRRRF